MAKTRLSKVRREMRIMACETASSMIEQYHTGGAFEEDVGLTKSEYKIFLEENKHIAVLSGKGLMN